MKNIKFMVVNEGGTISKKRLQHPRAACHRQCNCGELQIHTDCQFNIDGLSDNVVSAIMETVDQLNFVCFESVTDLSIGERYDMFALRRQEYHQQQPRINCVSLISSVGSLHLLQLEFDILIKTQLMFKRCSVSTGVRNCVISECFPKSFVVVLDRNVINLYSIAMWAVLMYKLEYSSLPEKLRSGLETIDLAAK